LADIPNRLAFPEIGEALKQRLLAPFREARPAAFPVFGAKYGYSTLFTVRIPPSGRRKELFLKLSKKRLPSRWKA
jgi:hypothetical protein